jgi:tetratricopeptide (TPR) repeat protein
LFALEEFLAPCQAIVTFNGKTFDLPLLKTRYIMQGWQAPFGNLAHLDLLQLARRLWRNRLPSRTLANLEAQILGTTRGQEDVPGWDIPRLYMQYLREGDPGPLKNVFYHNAMDVISLAALMNHMANMLEDPIGVGGEHGVDLIALAELFESIGRLDTATRLYIHGLDHEDVHAQRLPKHVLLRAIQRLALIYKRQENWENAIELWQQAARHNHLEAYLELAKCYEHRLSDYDEAIRWTQLAIELVEKPTLDFDAAGLNTYERRRWLDDLNHRLDRLQRKATHSS